MTARGAVSRQKERGLRAVILAAGGNPEEQRQPSGAFTQQDDSSLPVTLGLAMGIQPRSLLGSDANERPL